MCHVNHVLFKNIAVVQKQRSCQRKEHGLHIYELLCFMFTFSRVGEVLQDLTNYSAVTLLGFRRRRCRCVSGGTLCGTVLQSFPQREATVEKTVTRASVRVK